MREFLVRLVETNSIRVQSDVLNRIQESRSRLEVEIRKLLHEVSRIAEQALARARRVKKKESPQFKQRWITWMVRSARFLCLVDRWSPGLFKIDALAYQSCSDLIRL